MQSGAAKYASDELGHPPTGVKQGDPALKETPVEKLVVQQTGHEQAGHEQAGVSSEDARPVNSAAASAEDLDVDRCVRVDS